MNHFEVENQNRDLRKYRHFSPIMRCFHFLSDLDKDFSFEEFELLCEDLKNNNSDKFWAWKSRFHKANGQKSWTSEFDSDIHFMFVWKAISHTIRTGKDAIGWLGETTEPVIRVGTSNKEMKMNRFIKALKKERKLSMNHWRYRLLHTTFWCNPKTPAESPLPNFLYTHYCPLFHCTNLLLLFLPITMVVWLFRGSFKFILKPATCFVFDFVTYLVTTFWTCVLRQKRKEKNTEEFLRDFATYSPRSEYV